MALVSPKNELQVYTQTFPIVNITKKFRGKSLDPKCYFSGAESKRLKI